MKKNVLISALCAMFVWPSGYANNNPETLFASNDIPIHSRDINPSPDAQDDTAEVIKNSSGNVINVLVNDSFGVLGPLPGIALQVNGISNAGGNVTIDDNNTPNDPLDDTIRYFPPTDFVGLDTFTYTIVASNGSTDSSVVRVLVVDGIIETDDQPLAVDDVVELREDLSENVNVLSNDSFGEDGPSSGAISIVLPPTNGTATVDTNGTLLDPTDDTITYQGNPDYYGADVFAYEICDADGDCDTAFVSLTITNEDDQPLAVDDVIELLEDRSENVNVLVNDSFGGDGPSSGAITINTPPTHGTATVDTQGTPLDPMDDIIVYQGITDYYGADEFTYEICDADGDCDTALVALTITNEDDQPFAVDDALELQEDRSETIAVLSNDSFGGDGPSSSPIKIISPPNYGTATVSDNATPTDPTDDTIVYLGNPDYFGSDVFTYEICDADGDCDKALVSLTITNEDDQPLAEDDTFELLEDSSQNITVLANDSFGGDGPSSTAISIIATPAQGTATVDTNGTLSDPTDDSIVYEGAPDYYGSDTFTYEICDADGDCDTATVSLTITNQDDEPLAVNDAISMLEDTSEVIKVLSNDSFGGDGPSSDAISITVAPNNGTATVDTNGTPSDPTDDTIVYEGALDYFGSDVFTYQICDADGDCDTANVVITIADVEDLAGNMHLTKEGVYEDSNADEIVSAGDTITYTFTIENNGDLDLKNIVLVDDLEGIEVFGGPIDLAVGEEDDFTFTATYIITDQDVMNRQVVNIATAIGEDPKGEIVMDDSDDPFNPENIDTDQDGDPEDPTVVILQDPDGVIVYDSFSPNGDGVNEEFVIKRLIKYPENNLQIFNRWGVKVFDKDQYEQKGVARFSGLSDGRITIERGKALPVGTYYFKLSYVDDVNSPRTLSGSFYLLR